MKNRLEGSRNRENSRKGFTLVELIVVLVILAILAALTIPALLGWIDKAKEKQMLLEARTCYLAAQTLASEEYGKASPDRDSIDGEAVENLAGVAAGTVTEIVFEDDDLTEKEAFIVIGITYTKDNITAKYDRGQWTVSR